MMRHLTGIPYTFAVCILVTNAGIAHAQTEHCTALVQMSRTVSETLIQEDEFTDRRDHFCYEYQESRNQGRSANYGGSYKYLGFSMGKSSSSEDNVASKYCRFAGDTRQRDANYREYLEGIAPGAYSAYEACLNASKSGVEFSLLTPPTQNELTLAVFYKTDVSGASAQLEWDASKPVKCSWSRSGSESSKTSLDANSRVILRCQRKNATTPSVHEPDFVSAYRVGGGAQSVVSIPWVKYTENHEPIPTLTQIQSELHSEIVALTGTVNNVLTNLAGQVDAMEHVIDQMGHQTGTCSWEPVGYNKSHGHDIGPWCPPGTFIRQLNIDGCKGSGVCPVVGKVQCCKVVP